MVLVQQRVSKYVAVVSCKSGEACEDQTYNVDRRRAVAGNLVYYKTATLEKFEKNGLFEAKKKTQNTRKIDFSGLKKRPENVFAPYKIDFFW